MPATMLRELFDLNEMNDFPGPFAHRAHRVAEELRNTWNRTSREAVMGRRLADLHAARDDYYALLTGHLRLLEQYLTLTKLHQRAFGANSTWLDELNQAAAELKELHDGLFPRWQTEEDLQQILIEQLSLPADKLRDLATRFPPPASWYEETADPFTD